MKKRITTTYIFSSSLIQAFRWLLPVVLLHSGLLQAQCLEPSGLSTSGITNEAATFNWTSNNGPVTSHCWNLEVGGVGLTPGNGQAVVSVTVCEGDSDLAVSDNDLSFAVGGLQPGTSYTWCVTETCDGMAMPANLSGWTCLDGSFKTLDDPFTVTPTATPASCPSVSPGFLPDGTITLTIADGSSCPGGDYTVTQTGGPTNLLPTAYANVGAGTGLVFEHAGPGNYTFSVTENGNCNPPNPTITVTVMVPEGTDAEDPLWYVYDMLGNVVLDNDPETDPQADLNLGTVIIPEGSCSLQQQLFAYGMDNCDGLIIAPDAVTVSATTSPATVNPGTQVSVTPNGQGDYAININWSVSTSTVTMTMCDATGNCPDLSLTAYVDDNINPEIIAAAADYLIPVCEAFISPVYGFSIVDLCDQYVDAGDLTVEIAGFPGATVTPFFQSGGYFEYTLNGLTAGSGFLKINYTDASGNAATTALPAITVAQAAEDMPPVIIAADENVPAPVCQGDTYVTYSFQILDDCSDINVGDVAFDDGGAGLVSSWVDVDNANNTVYLAYEGTVAPGSYFMTISYQGSSVQPLLEVQAQADQDPAVVLPGNLNFTIPVCESELTTTFSITISDDCDDPVNAANASFSLGGATITPTFVNAEDGYFEFTETMTVVNDGDLLAASYTDGGGNTTDVSALMTVTGQPDNWAPIIIYPGQDINIELDPCAPPTAVIAFEVTATDNCDGEVLPAVTVDGGTLESPNPGDGNTYLWIGAPGSYQVVIIASDAAGNTREEQFLINVTQEPAPTSNLVCNDNIIVTLNEHCEAVIIPDMVLEGEFGCLTDANFEITVVDSDIANGAVVDGPGTYDYEVLRLDGSVYSGFGLSAGPFAASSGNWTIVEDFDLNDSDGDSYAEVTFTPATLTLETFDADEASASVVIPEDGHLSFDWELSLGDFSNSGTIYDEFYIRITLISNATVETIAEVDEDVVDVTPGQNPQLFSGTVDIDVSAGDVLLIQIDDDLAEPVVGEDFPNVATITNFTFDGGVEESVLCWGTLTAEDKTNPTIDCPADTDQAVVDGEAFDLICADFDEIYNNPASFDYVGTPATADNCTNPTPFTFSDTFVEDGDCGDVIITRTFVTEDEAGRTASCTQQITLRKPVLDDVTLPEPVVNLDCAATYPLAANGNPGPEATGYPFVTTAFGAFDLNETYCNLAADYTDGNALDICEGTTKFVRTWTLLDWCNPAEVLTFTQTVKIGDTEGPVLTCPATDNDGGVLTYSTGPFNCTAALEVPLPQVTDDCSGAIFLLTEIVTDIEVDDLNQYGQVIGSHTETIVVATIPHGEPRYISGIPVGQHRFRYTATDDCGNVSIIECDFQVVDAVPPVAVCNDDLHVAIGAEGYARVYAEDIDEGSTDNCGAVRIEVRRLIDEDEECNFITPYYTDWGPFVEFNCCDVADVVTVEMRVWDDADGDGVFGSEGDNSNVCWLEVLVEDKVVPVCVPPHNVTLDCDEVPYDLDPYNVNQLRELFGNATTEDNCTADPQELPPIVNLSDCGFGTISRRFRAIDHYGNTSVNTCHQVITINEVHDYEIKFPRDASANCGEPVVDTIEYNEIACDLLAVSVEDEFFSASDDECYKIFRTYRVINWCEYDGQADPVVVSRDEDCDGNPGDEDVWVLVRPNGVTYFDRDNDENNTNPFAAAKGTSCDGLTNPTGHWINSTFDANATRDPITGEEDPVNVGESLPVDEIRDIASRGYWQYTQHIKVYDNVDPVITVGSFEDFCSLDNVDCDAPVDIPFSVEENCTPDDLEVKEVFLDAFYDGNFSADFTLADGAYEVTGSYPDYQIVSAGLPLGDHAFEVHVKDGCGNVDALLIPFSVIDCKAPTPVCISGLAVELMPTEPGVDADGDGDTDAGAIAIWATDFLADSPVTDCSGPVTYSINRSGGAPAQNQTSLILTCDDLGSVFVEIHAWDDAGNHDFCETYILVQDNLNSLCGGAAQIAGIIETEQQNGLEGAQVNLSGNLSLTLETNQFGEYLFQQLDPGYDYSIQPVLDTDPFNGVSTFDLVLISRHILGTTPLNSPYKMIAADVNNSRSITTLDLIQARKGVLGLIDDYPNNTSWRFVDAAYVFPDPTDPWEDVFPEIANFNDLPATENAADFVAVKIGDVNGSASYSAGLATPEERSAGDPFTIATADRLLQAGETCTVTFTTRRLSAIQGYQFTLNVDPDLAEVADILYGVAREENFGWRFVDEGLITTSWHRSAEGAPVRPTTDEVLFSLVLRPVRTVSLSEVLRISSWRTAAEAYDLNDQILPVALDFEHPAVTPPVFALLQNTPNPFREETLIGFELPKAAPVTLKIHDLTGRLLQWLRIEGVQGYNQLTIDRKQLQESTGVLYYTIETDGFVATKKMLLMD